MENNIRKIEKEYSLINLNGFLGNISIRELHYDDGTIDYRVFNNDSHNFIAYDAKMAIKNIASGNNPFLAEIEKQLVSCMESKVSAYNLYNIGRPVEIDEQNDINSLVI